MATFKITDALIEQIQQLIEEKRNKELIALLSDLHYADITEAIHELNAGEDVYTIRLVGAQKTSDVLTKLDDGYRDKILKRLSAKEIADEILKSDADDTMDIISELLKKRETEVISYIEDVKHAKDIVDLLRYDEHTAGGLMAKELVKVNENWSILKCMKGMRGQVTSVTRVHSIYVVDDNNVLRGRLPLKDLLTTSTRSEVKDIYIPEVDYIYVTGIAEEVAHIVSKYDLEAIPIVDEMKCLVERITIDDVVDVIKEEAEKDYQLAAGITHDVEADDSAWRLAKTRLPWLLIGMFGGLGAAGIINGFQDTMNIYPILLIFIPLIQATAGNVGVQSSAIVVQGLANNSIDGEIIKRLLKEFLLGLINGGTIAGIIILVSHLTFKAEYLVSITVAIALVAVVVNTAVVDTFIPILLHKRGIDPAVAAGPFITISSGILGTLICFFIARLILGF